MMFNKIQINSVYDVRDEGEREVFFSGNTRCLHYISKDAYKLIKMAESISFDELIFSISTSEDDVKKVKSFFEELRRKGIVVFL